MYRTTRTRKKDPRLPALALPSELVVDVLEYLPTDDLWAAACVSRQFYWAAWHAGLSIDCQVDVCLDTGSVDGIDEFKDLVDHVVPKDIRISLSLKCLSDAKFQPPQGAGIDNAIHASLHELVGVIPVALPLLAHLSIELPDRFLPGLLRALDHPAPRLKILMISNTTLYPAPLPPDLFAGSAPQLRALFLTSTTLPDEPVAAFCSLSFVWLAYYKVFPQIAIARYFPRVTGLCLSLIAAIRAVAPHRFDLSELALRRMFIDDRGSAGMMASVERSIDLSTVPVLQVTSGETIGWTERLWTQDIANLSVRLALWQENQEHVCISVVPEHRRWRRIYRLLASSDKRLSLSGLPNVSARLTYLHIDAVLLSSFLVLELTLDVLCDLHIDVRTNGIDCELLSPLGYHADVALKSFLPRISEQVGERGLHAPCPALEELTLFAIDAPIPTLESRHVAHLLCALGQVERPQREKTALSLVGVTFARPVARTLLNQTVSAIRTYAFAGRGSCEDYDEGLWEAMV